jgi:hypothetical protein
MARDRQKQNYKAGWLVNSPNNYVKQEMEETGTQNPKKFSKVCIHPISFRYQSNINARGSTEPVIAHLIYKGNSLHQKPLALCPSLVKIG